MAPVLPPAPPEIPTVDRIEPVAPKEIIGLHIVQVVETFWEFGADARGPHSGGDGRRGTEYSLYFWSDGIVTWKPERI